MYLAAMNSVFPLRRFFKFSFCSVGDLMGSISYNTVIVTLSNFEDACLFIKFEPDEENTARVAQW